MDTMDCIVTRRSIRRYTGERVTRAELDEMLRAGMYAPSAMGRFPWAFVVFDDPKALRAVTQAHPYAAFAPQAGLAVLVCADLNQTSNLYYACQDCSAATQNMLLAAHNLGLGACWCGVLPDEDRMAAFRRIAGIEDQNIVPVSLAVIGRPAALPRTPERFDPARIHYNAW